MEIQNLLDKFVRFSWQVDYKNQLDIQIRNSLRGEIGLDQCFMTPPHPGLMQALALPLILQLAYTRDHRVNEDNPWRTRLSRDERRQILRYYGLHSKHRTIYHLASDESQIAILAAYIGATYAFTVQQAPIVIPMEQLVTEINTSYDGDSRKLQLVNQTGLLIVTNPVGLYRGMPKITGNLTALFSRRLSIGKLTVFIDPIFAKVKKLLIEGKRPSRDFLSEELMKTPLGKHEVVRRWLDSDCSYINLSMEDPMREINEYRDSILI